MTLLPRNLKYNYICIKKKAYSVLRADLPLLFTPLCYCNKVLYN